MIVQSQSSEEKVQTEKKIKIKNVKRIIVFSFPEFKRHFHYLCVIHRIHNSNIILFHTFANLSVEKTRAHCTVYIHLSSFSFHEAFFRLYHIDRNYTGYCRWTFLFRSIDSAVILENWVRRTLLLSLFWSKLCLWQNNWRKLCHHYFQLRLLRRLRLSFFFLFWFHFNKFLFAAKHFLSFSLSRNLKYVSIQKVIFVKSSCVSRPSPIEIQIINLFVLHFNWDFFLGLALAGLLRCFRNVVAIEWDCFR